MVTGNRKPGRVVRRVDGYKIPTSSIQRTALSTQRKTGFRRVRNKIHPLMVRIRFTKTAGKKAMFCSHSRRGVTKISRC